MVVVVGVGGGVAVVRGSCFRVGLGRYGVSVTGVGAGVAELL